LDLNLWGLEKVTNSSVPLNTSLQQMAMGVERLMSKNLPQRLELL
jgi:hypothetical protein